MWGRVVLVCLLAVLSGCQTLAPAPSLVAPEGGGSLNLFQARLRLAISHTRQIQALPDAWDEAQVTVESARLKAAASDTLTTATSSLSPAFTLPTGPATVSVQLRVQGILMATGSAEATLSAGVNSVSVTMSPLTNHVWTLAGDGTSGSVDGVGAGARVNGPRGLAVDASGSLFVADTYNHLIRKITPYGEVTTIAGSPSVSGYSDGANTSALFNAPHGIAIDSNGNLFVADSGNHVIRRIDLAGNVTTVAGSPSVSGFVNATGTDAIFNLPWGVAIDSGANYLYVTDFNNDAVRQIDLVTSGVTTFTTTSVSGPSGLAIDASDNLLIANASASTILEITPGGTVTVVAGTGTAGFSGDGGAATSAQFDKPRAVSTDSNGDVYVADTFNYRIRKFTRGGNVTTIAGDGTNAMQDGPAASARFGALFGIAVRGAGARVYVADWAHHRLRVMLP